MKRHYPEVSALILACTQTDWSRRPTSIDIQAAGLFQEKGNGAEILRAELRALKAETVKKDRLIQSQKEQMKDMEDTIEKLRRRLAEVGMDVEADPVGEDPVVIKDSSCSRHDDN